MDYKQASDKELLKILVRERNGETVVDDLFNEFNIIDSIIATSTEEELIKIKNIGISRAKQIKAAFELANRLYTREFTNKISIKSPKDVVNIVLPEMRFLQKEYFKILLLNTKNQVIGNYDVSIGSLNASIVHPREVFNLAIKRSAASIICIHNHPGGSGSGNCKPTPSKEDLSVTERLVEAGKVIGINVLDHVIVAYGSNKYTSFKEEGYMD